MIHKKFVAIVLAAGLVLSIGFVLGQYNIGKNDIGRLLNQEQSTLGIAPNYSLEEQDTRMSADEPEIGIFTPPIEYSAVENEEVWSPVIVRYYISHRVPNDKNDLVAIIDIVCEDLTGVGGSIYFESDQSYDETDPHIEGTLSTRFIITLPYSRYDEIIDSLRNDRHMRVYLGRDPSDSSRRSAIITSEGIVSDSP